ncbi:MAG: hypothetical protein ABW061_15150 [Polyangiaceae bacterium]
MTERTAIALAWRKATGLALFAIIATACNTAAVKHSYMSLDQDGNRKRTVFYTDTDKIYCIGEMAIGRKDISITAALRTTALAPPPSGTLAPLASTLAVKDVTPAATGSDVLVAFQIVKSDMKAPWPAGDFVCDLAIDGELSASIPFQIEYPDCPLAPPRAGDSCAGFFLPQSECVGALSAQRCVCTDDGVWQCR